MFLFSIIIPTWKKSHTLIKTLEAIRKQKMFLNKTEIIICGETKKLNLKYIKNLKKILILNSLMLKKTRLAKKGI